jgi:hypothetical protein
MSRRTLRLSLATLFPATLFLAAGPAAAADFACPAVLVLHPTQKADVPDGWAVREQGETHWLDGASVFDGPPEEQADLVPDNENAAPSAAVWTLDPKSERGYWLACRYEGTETTLAAKVPTGAKKCAVSKKKGDGVGYRGGRKVTDGSVIDVTCR